MSTGTLPETLQAMNAPQCPCAARQSATGGSTTPGDPSAEQCNVCEPAHETLHPTMLTLYNKVDIINAVRQPLNNAMPRQLARIPNKDTKIRSHSTDQRAWHKASLAQTDLPTTDGIVSPRHQGRWHAGRGGRPSYISDEHRGNRSASLCSCGIHPGSSKRKR